MLCVIAKIDDAAQARLEPLCRLAEEFGLPARELYGHITLVTYLGEEQNKFIERCKESLLEQKSFSVCYHRIESLLPTPSIVVSPEMTEELRLIHAKLMAAAPNDLSIWSSKEHWHPHTTLFYHEEADLKAISERIKKEFVPFVAQISKIEFSRVTDGGYKIVDFVTLRAGI